jgi:hypothetical protein
MSLFPNARFQCFLIICSRQAYFFLMIHACALLYDMPS